MKNIAIFLVSIAVSFWLCFYMAKRNSKTVINTEYKILKDTTIIVKKDTVIIHDTIRVQKIIKQVFTIEKTDSITGESEQLNCYPINEKFDKGEISGSLCSRFIPKFDTTAKLDLNLYLYPDSIHYTSDSTILFVEPTQPKKNYFWEGTAVGSVVSILILYGFSKILK